MPTILPTNFYPESSRSILKQVLPQNFNLIFLDEPSKEDLLNKIKYTEYLLVGGRLPIDGSVLKAAQNLKMIQRTGVGLDSLNMDALRRKGVPVYINKGVNSRSVAEHTIMLILSVLRKLTVADSILKQGKWVKHELGMQTHELYEKNVGLVGVGHIGQVVAQMLKPFEVKLFYYDPVRLTNKSEIELNINYLPFTELLGKVDILSLHCPLNAKTKGIIGEREISLMKKGSIVINTSRGALINETALEKGLSTGKIKGAGLDVFSKEPLSGNNNIIKYNNVILTPHIGGVTADAFRRMMKEAFQNIKLFEEGNLTAIEEKKLELF